MTVDYVSSCNRSCPELNDVTVQLLVLLLECGVFDVEEDVDDAERNMSRIAVKDGLCLCNGQCFR